MQVKRYEWSENFRQKADAEAVGKFIEKLGKRLGKEVEGIAPADLVEEARNPASPMHSLFTWDDSEAARKFREEEARLVLRSIRIVVENTSGKETTFIGRVSVKPSPDSSERLYVPTDLATSREFTRQQMLADALTGLEGWRRRYSMLEGIGPVLAEIDKGIEALKAVQAKAQPKPKRKLETAAVSL